MEAECCTIAHSLIPESPRWLLAQDRDDEAEAIIRHIADINERELPDKLEFELPKEDDGQKGKFTDLFKYPVLRREILIIYLGW